MCLEKIEARLRSENHERHNAIMNSVVGGNVQLESRLKEHIEAHVKEHVESHNPSFQQHSSNESLRLVGQEFSHKLNAVSCSLLELITEVVLTGGTQAEDEKRQKLRNRLC